MGKESFDQFWVGVDLSELRFKQSAFTDRVTFDRFWAGVDFAELMFLRSGFNPR